MKYLNMLTANTHKHSQLPCLALENSLSVWFVPLCTFGRLAKGYIKTKNIQNMTQTVFS